MNGVHDMGGSHQVGAIAPEPDEPVFHERWEGVTFGVQVAGATAGYWTSDEYRFAIEQMPPAEYLSTSYFEHWLSAMEKIFIAKGLFTQEEYRRALDAARADRSPAAGEAEPVPPELLEAVGNVIAQGGLCSRDVPQAPRFHVGDAVQARRDAPSGHTRLARYVRGATGEIVMSHGAFVFPDTLAEGRGVERPQYVYAVRFVGTELWGRDAEPGTTFTIDLWESYLQSARGSTSSPTITNRG
ncbi:nitrile hydratase subunit beta [Kribbella yunnanensis]|uniref:Nitrile hydratase subunit beta n=1 Tax=Kribbella yunnanensis TaxID=190194 RepID=A0ABN2IK21_9ACTN